VDPHVPHGRADAPGAQHDPEPDPPTVAPGQQAISVAVRTTPGRDITGGNTSVTELVQGPPWTNSLGGPAVLWRCYFDSGADALALADLLVDRCRAGGVTVEIKGVDEYTGRNELLGVRGLLCVLSSEPPNSPRPGNTVLFRRIVQDFRAKYPITAADGFHPGSDRWHRVGVLEVFYTDHALEDPDGLAIIEEACAGHPYTPGVTFTGDVFEVFEAGKAQQVKENDQVAATNAVVWKRLRRWGVDTVDRARIIRHEVEDEVDLLEDPRKKAMYRPHSEIDHNQLWLVLHDTEARPPADPNKTDEENHDANKLFVANGARAVRGLVERLESTYEWFREPNDVKRRGAQLHFARLYEALRTVTRNS
jgi:hypothetical protein